MRKNRNFLESLKYAFSGFIYAIRYEKNLRFHVWACIMVVIFALFFGLERLEWLFLIITISFVIVAELVNTSIENAVDTATNRYSKTAKIAKDVAAGAVLVSAFMAICVAIVLFGDINRVIETIHKIYSSLVSGVIVSLFIIFGISFTIFNKK